MESTNLQDFGQQKMRLTKIFQPNLQSTDGLPPPYWWSQKNYDIRVNQKTLARGWYSIPQMTYGYSVLSKFHSSYTRNLEKNDSLKKASKKEVEKKKVESSILGWMAGVLAGHYPHIFF